METQIHNNVVEKRKKFWFNFLTFLRPRKKHNDLLKKLVEIEALVSENASQLEIAKSSFLKNIYHEIRTPLNAIIGFTSLLEQKDISEDQKDRYMQNVNRSSKEFLRIMDDIVQASLLEAGMVKLNQEECKPYRMMNELHAFFTIRKHMLEKGNVAILQNIPDELKEVTFLADSMRINQIMTQLLDNALKFTDKGIVEYGYKIQDEQLKFYVRDSGVGGLDKYKETVFQSFTKLDESDTAKDGLGLGLSIAQKLVKLMNGKITCSSNKKSGTTFCFSIPYVPVKLGASRLGTEEKARKKISIFNGVAF